MVTINELLNTMEFLKNQTLLANDLGVNRGTLRKYMNDLDGEFHQVRVFNGKRQLLVLTSKKNKA